MNVWPVIHRELRAEARHPFNHWLRVLSASALLGVFATMIRDQPANASERGAELFGNLNTALFAAIWLLVPLLTADCISRERRDGTLGLLFLTPLSARGVVVGKSLIHALRATTLLLAALPVLALPYLLGGVSWREAVMALLLDLSSVCVALAAGLVASSRCTQWNRALFLAEILAAIFLLIFGGLLFFALIFQVAVPFVPGFAPGEVAFDEMIVGTALTCTDANGMWSEAFGDLPAAATRAWLITVGEAALLALLSLALVVCGVARRLEHSRREEPLSSRQLRWRQFLLAPRFWKSQFQHKTRRALERNPIGWLQQYSTTARLTKWGWLLFIALLESLALADAGWLAFAAVQRLLLVLLALSLAFCAAGSFRRERQTGALELIMVTPLSVGQIIFGRLRGLWGQFIPGAAILAVVGLTLFQSGVFDIMAWHYDPDNNRNAAFAIFALTSFVALPVVGLYFSLTQRHFLAAWLLTLGVCLLLPYPVLLLWAIFDGASWDRPSLSFGSSSWFQPGPPWESTGESAVLVQAAILQLFFAFLAGCLLYRNLRRRKFALGT